MAAHTDPLRAVAQLQDVVHQLAPTLRPQVLPRGTAYGLDLVLGLCNTAAQKQALRTLVQATKPASNSDNSNRNANNDTNELGAQAIGSFDVANKWFNIEKIVWMTPQDALVHELARFLELQLDNADEAAPIVAHFLKTNGHAPSNTLAAEQCLNAAFALQTLLRAFPRPPIAVAGALVEIDDNTDVVQVFAPLLSTKKTNKQTTAKSAANGNSSKNSRSKSKKRASS